jgi:hypothetical protein
MNKIDAMPNAAPVENANVETGTAPAPSSQPTASPVETPAGADPSPAGEPAPQNAPVVQDWKEHLPEAWRGQVDGLNSLEEALDAMKRGMDYQPVTDTAALDDVFKGMEVDAGMNAEFRKLAVEHGLTEAQVRALVKFEADSFAAMEKQWVDDATAKLKQVWGGEFDRKADSAMAAMLRFDKEMGGRLSEWLGGKDGLRNSPVAMELLAVIGGKISEDTVPGATSGAGAEKAESPRETYRGMFH